MTLKNKFRANYVLIIFLFIFAATFAFLRARSADDIEAASLANFDPGNIMSDYVMSNYTSMSEQEIQNFLTSKNSCGNTNYSYYQSLSTSKPSIKWHWANGHFVCLSEELFGDGEVIGSGETAAHIIWQAAQDYRINPQVLLALIQKESSLITDPIPNDYDYRKATGYGCPDTAACSSKYYGFKNQVRNAAALFRTVLDGGWTNYPLGENYIQYNPTPSCGGSIVNIQNLATSALYRYTPYQPNPAAIAAGYGSAPCGAYGNRNFYLIFSDWFGNPQAEANNYISNPTIATFPEGDYYIVLNTDYNQAVQLTTHDNNEFNKIILGDRNSSEDAVFQLRDNHDGTYSIINKYSGKAIDTPTANIAPDIQVQQFTDNNTNAQKWYIYKNNDGSYSFSSIFNKRFALTAKDNRLVFDYYNATQEQTFRFVQVNPTIKDGDYNIVSVLNNYALDVHVSDSYNIWAFASNHTEAQKWRVTFNSLTGEYSIVNPLTNKNLRTVGQYSGANVNVGSTADCANKWLIFSSNNDDYEIYSSCNIDLAIDYSIGRNHNIQVFESNHTLAQRWDFSEIVAPKEEKIEQKADKTAKQNLEGVYYIYSAITPSRAFDLHVADNNNLWIFESNHTLAQRWRLTYDETTDAYNITSLYNNYNLDISSVAPSTSVFAHIQNGNCSQRWKVIQQENNTYEIVSTCNPLVAMDYSVFYNHDVRIHYRNNTLAQRWILTLAE